MRFWLSLVTVPEINQLPKIAALAEQFGYHGVTVADHLFMPTKIESRYPYTEDGEIFWPMDTPWPDPWAVLSAMAVATENLELTTNICLAALRDPFTTAKGVATADVLSNGRVSCGVAVGWIAEEYAAAGLDFNSRGKRLDELIGVLRSLWTGDSVAHQGKFYNFPELFMRPTPVHDVPIWCGGGSPLALRRAATLCDGWLGLPMETDDLLQVVQGLRNMRQQAGLDPWDFRVFAAPLSPPNAELCARLSGEGINDFVTISPWFPSPWGQSWCDEGDNPAELAVKKKSISRFAETYIQS